MKKTARLATRLIAYGGLAAALALAGVVTARAQDTLLNVSYDPTRELYEAIQRRLRQATGRPTPAAPSPSSRAMAARASRPRR